MIQHLFTFTFNHKILHRSFWCHLQGSWCWVSLQSHFQTISSPPAFRVQETFKLMFLKHSPNKLCTSIACMIFSLVETLKGLSNCTCSPLFQFIANHNFPKTSGHGLHKMSPLDSTQTHLQSTTFHYYDSFCEGWLSFYF